MSPLSKKQLFILWLIIQSVSLVHATNVSCYNALLSVYGNQREARDIDNTILSAELDVLRTQWTTKDSKPQLSHPTHTDLTHDRQLETQWNQPPDEQHPFVLRKVLPKGMYFIDHHLKQTRDPMSVQLDALDSGRFFYVRVHWKHEGQAMATNVLFSRTALDDNIKNFTPSGQKYIVGKTAKAVVVFLHGGGTKTTGAFTSTPVLSYLSNYGIEGIAVDLNMHAGGPRTFHGDLDHSILALGTLLKKYIPKDTPVIIASHSFGAVIAHRIMQMTGEKEDYSFIHPGLKGVILGSAPVLTKLKGTPTEKMRDMVARTQQSAEQTKDSPMGEHQHINRLIENDGVSMLGGWYEAFVMSQIDYGIPEHKGKNYIPTRMLMGQHDSMVYYTFKDLVHEVYDNLENVETFYFDKRVNIETEEEEGVGHMLNNYRSSEDNHTPILFWYSLDFVSQVLGIPIEQLAQHKRVSSVPKSPVVTLALLYANSLSFRSWLRNLTRHYLFSSHTETQASIEIYRQINKKIERLARVHNIYYESIYILKQITIVESKKDLASHIERLKVIQPLLNSKNDQALIELITQLDALSQRSRSTLTEIRQVARDFLHTPSYLSLSDHKSISQIHSLVHQPEKKGTETKEVQISHLLDQFPLNSTETHNPFRLPDTVKNEIMTLLAKYQQAVWNHHKSSIQRTIRFILTEHHPITILYRTLQALLQIQETPAPSSLSQRLTEDYQYFSKIPHYRELAKDIQNLINQIKKHPDSLGEPIQLFISRHQLPYEKTPHTAPVQLIETTWKEQGVKWTPEEITTEVINHAIKNQIPSWNPSEEINQLLQTLIDQYRESPPNLRQMTQQFVTQHLPENRLFLLIQELKKQILPETLLFLKDSYLAQQNEHLLYTDIDWNALLHPQTPLSRKKRIAELALNMFITIKIPTTSLIKQTLDSADALEQALKKEPIPEDIKEELRVLLLQKQMLNQIAKEEHIPSIEDFYANSESKPSEKQISGYKEKISKITNISNRLKELRNRIQHLSREKRKHRKNIQRLTEEVRRSIKVVQSHLEQREPIHPSLTKSYTDLQKTSEALYQSADVILELLYLQAGLTVETSSKDTLQPSIIEEHLMENRKIQRAINDFSRRLELMQQKRTEYRIQVLQLAQKGELGESLESATSSLVSVSENNNAVQYNGSSYSNLEHQIRSMAEIESEIHSAENEAALLTIQYYQLHPSPSLYTDQYADITTIDLTADRTLTKEQATRRYFEHIESLEPLFREIIKDYKEQASHLPPLVPLF